MANTYSKLYVMFVFATKYNQRILRDNKREELYKYISGIIKNKNQELIFINGMSDHVHILLSFKPNCKLSKLVQEIKSNSTKWINNSNMFKGKFSWQKGYGAFSYSFSEIDKVKKYVMNQEEHHKKLSFKEEYLKILDEFNIDYNKEYLFEFNE